jgi:hypothetical protein
MNYMSPTHHVRLEKLIEKEKEKEDGLGKGECLKP